MAFKKKTIGQKRDERQAAAAKAPKKAGGDPIDQLVAKINSQLAGGGRVFRGSEIEKRDWQRRSSGIPTFDFLSDGGYPRGGLVELGGEFSVGKTTAAIHFLRAIQQNEPGAAVAWVAIEPFSKRWARGNGFFIPFSEEHGDPFENASPLELYRMEQAGITDPYKEITPFVLVQEERGDVALDASLTLIKSNRLAAVVVDSLGVAKSTKWLLEAEVQDAGDFPREAKMIGDYTTRAVLSLNKRYDDTGAEAKDGKHYNQTTVLHLNHISTNVGTQARAAHKLFRLKGGEGNKHNHHCIIFMWKGKDFMIDLSADRRYTYGREVNAICIKSKIGPEQRSGSYDFYYQPYESFQAGDIDVVKDLVGLALTAGILKRSGSWIEFETIKEQSREKFQDVLRAWPEMFQYLHGQTMEALKSK